MKIIPLGMAPGICYKITLLNEKQLCLYVAAEAMVLGRGCVSLMSQATGILRPTITKRFQINGHVHLVIVGEGPKFQVDH